MRPRASRLTSPLTCWRIRSLRAALCAPPSPLSQRGMYCVHEGDGWSMGRLSACLTVPTKHAQPNACGSAWKSMMLSRACSLHREQPRLLLVCQCSLHLVRLPAMLRDSMASILISAQAWYVLLCFSQPDQSVCNDCRQLYEVLPFGMSLQTTDHHDHQDRSSTSRSM